jgi:hypothetical protein
MILSVTKVQLYVWLFAAVAAYLYLLAAWVLAQGKHELVDIPPNIVTLALISISTTVVSTGIASLSGAKGSGPFDPTPADLISSGGEIAAERVQQLIWTLIAAPAFVVFAYMLPPDHLTPDSMATVAVPDHFLQLMGLSSTGYVAGKLARGPGPKITSLAASLVTGPPPFLTLSVRGSDIQTRGAAFTLRDLAMPDAKDIPLPVTPLPSSTIDSSGVATALDLSVPAAGLRKPAAGAPWGYAFTIIAADGEKAEWHF